MASVSVTHRGDRRNRAAKVWNDYVGMRERHAATKHARDMEKTGVTEAGMDRRTGMTNQTQRDVTNLQSAHGMARQTLSGQQDLARQGLVGQQEEASQGRTQAFTAGESALQRGHGMAIQGLTGDQAYQREALGVAGKVLEAGGTGAGRIATATPDFIGGALSRANVPQTEAGPDYVTMDRGQGMVGSVPTNLGQGVFERTPQGLRELPTLAQPSETHLAEMHKLKGNKDAEDEFISMYGYLPY